jgi:hypothetical protein
VKSGGNDARAKRPERYSPTRRFAQEREGQLFAAPVHLQLLLHGLQRVGADGHVGGPVGAEDQQPRGVGSPREHRQHVGRARVAPVQVLQEEDERAIRAHRIERLDDLAEHALAGRSGRPSLHRLQLVVGEQGRQLREPRRRILLEDPDERLPSRLATQAPERLEHRQIRLGGAVLLDALAAADAEPVGVAELGEERVDQRGLPDPGLAGHEDQLACAVDRGREERVQPRQLGGAPHERRGR